MSAPDRARFQPQIFLLSLAAILLEISYTRILSFKLVYYFTYLVIGLALLGLGAGGIVVSLSERLRAWATERLVTMAAIGTAGAVVVGYLVIAGVQLNAFDMVQAAASGDGATAAREGAKLVTIAFLLALPFFCAGVGITAILATQPAHANRLYFADLIGAAIGCAISVPLMATISPPGCVMLAGAVAATAAWPGLRGGGRMLVGVAAAALLLLALQPSVLPDPVVDRVKTLAPKDPPHHVLFSRWSPVFRVDVLEPTPDFLKGQSFKMLVHDGMWGSIMRAGGKNVSLEFFDRDARILPFTVLRPDPRVVVIGAAGGAEILASLHRNASHVTGVELNPVTVGLLTDQFADFTGRLGEDPRVTLVCAEGRTWLTRSREPTDLVWFVAPDSYAAMNAATSGAFVLSESYLYTVEMIVESLERLAPGGVTAIQFGELDFAGKPNRTLRYLVTAREALRRLGITDAGSHILVSTTSGFGLTSSTILVKRDPFTAAESARFAAATRALDGGVVQWAPPDEPPGRIATVIAGDDAALATWLAEWPFDVSAVHDDAPFFWHFVPFRAALTSSAGGHAMEHGLGEQLLMALLACAVLLATLFLAAPLMARWSRWRNMPGKLAAGVYFAALGLGFMFFEIPLVQRLTLFLGYPTYSLTVTLCGLLISTAVGALWGERLTIPARRLLPILLVCLAGLVVVYRVAVPPIIAHWIVADLPVRIMVTLAMLAPLGLCLGMFMPIGLRTIGALAAENSAEYVAWAWAVNGFFSVMSSLLATILAMSFGFDAVLLIALGVYAVGVAAFLAIPLPAGAR